MRTHFQVCMPGETEYKTTEINKYEYWDIRVTPSFVIPRMVKHWKTHLDKPKKYTSEVDQDADLALEMTMQPDASRVREYVDRAGNVTTYLYGDSGCNLLAVVKMFLTMMFLLHYKVLLAWGNITLLPPRRQP